MGTWGPAIFSDDLAVEIRGEFRELVGEGKSPEEATNALLTQFASSLDDEDEAPRFWMALAATQWQCGRLLKKVRDRAIAILDAGGDLAAWKADDLAEDKHVEGRARALKKLRAQLGQPPPPPRRIPRPYHYRTDWDVGHIVAYRRSSGKRVLLRVVCVEAGRKSRCPIVELLEDRAIDLRWAQFEEQPALYERWYERRLREALALKRKADRRYAIANANQHSFRIYLVAYAERDIPLDRLEVIQTGVPVKTNSTIGATLVSWRDLDEHLQFVFGLK